MDQRYVEIPGSKTHELPPLLLHSATDPVTDMASVMLEAEDMLASTNADEEILERRKLDLAILLTEQYKGLLAHWFWGDSVVEWIRQCEITFESEGTLRRFLHPDVWPNVGRSSFVELLREKEVPTGGVVIEKAVGLRVHYRELPPIGCFSSQTLVYLSGIVAETVYHTWAHPGALFPPNRFHFDVLDVS